jgi:hypothetical protein
MDAPAPRPTTARLLAVGDKISVLTPDDVVCRVTITEIHDDEPNRRIRITVREDDTGRMGDIDAAPGDNFDRQAHPDDLREAVIVTATDYWKWIGTHINHPDTGQRVQIVDVRRVRHPQNRREIMALVVASGPPLIFSELTDHMVFEDN